MINGNVVDKYSDDPHYVAGRYLNLSDDDGNVIPAVDAFCEAYAQALLWANTFVGENHEDYEAADGGMVDYAYAYISPGRWWEDIGIDFTDAVDFLSANLDTLTFVNESVAVSSRVEAHGWWALHGHDFALTRNGHGAGFWDRGYGDVGETLSDAARAYGEHNLYVDTDDKIWNE